MPNILSTGLSGMLAFQRALETTGHNIANVGTDGYSRQVVEFGTRLGVGSGGGYIGSGVGIESVSRIYDDIIGSQLQSSTTSHARFETMGDLAGRLDILLADPSTGLNAQLQSFFNSVQDIANDPASLPTRQALLGEADGLVLRFAELDRQLGDMSAEIDLRLNAAVDEINYLTSSIAELNRQIGASNPGGNRQPNDLLDQRDLMVRDLAALVSIDTVTQDDGSMNVFMGNGQNLVSGSLSQQLATQPSEFDPTRVDVVIEGSSSTTPLGSGLSGGVLGGLVEFRTNMLDPARLSLGQTAQAMAFSFNEQHAAGMDLYGNLGGEFFGIADPAVSASSGNAGTGTATAAISDPGLLTGANYILEFDGASYSLLNAETAEPVSMTGTGTAADPFLANGVSIVVGGSPAAGDRLLVQPSLNGAGSISRTLTDPQALAMAVPTRTSASLSNIGSGSIAATEILDSTDPSLLATSTLQFTSPNTYSINGAGSFAYVSGDPILINGSQFTIEGEPSVGDTFTLEANTGASGDNRNGLALANLQTVGILENGTVSINESYGQLVASIGSTSRQVQANLNAQTVVLANIENTMLAKSGVNLDEEAANLLRYQQSYEAMAQVISVANQMFDSLLAATRR